MPKILTPERAIKALEDFAILPYQPACPTLYIIVQDSMDESSKSYLRVLEKKSDQYGSEIKIVEANTMISAVNAISRIRLTPAACGILVLGTYGIVEDSTIHNMIPVSLDIDCNSASAYGMFVKNTSPVGYRDAPCTAIACYKMLEYENYKLDGAKVGIVGRSFRVGRPLAEIFASKNATVTLYNSYSNLSDIKDKDVVVTAIGKPKFFTADMFSPGQWVLDVGVNVDENGKLCGDVDFESVCEKIGDEGAITPVPGGIGPLTNAVLFSKLFYNYASANGIFRE